MAAVLESTLATLPNTATDQALPRPLRALLPMRIAHHQAGNKRLHLATSIVAWLGLVTALSAIPTLHLGEFFALLSALLFVSVDALVALLVLALTTAWALLLGTSWGTPTSLVLGLCMWLAMQVAQHFAHVFHHEHAPFLSASQRRSVRWNEALFGVFHFTLTALLDRGFRPALRARLEASEREMLLRVGPLAWSNWGKTAHCQAHQASVPETIAGLVAVVREALSQGRRVRVLGSGFSWSALVPTGDLLVFSERLDKVEVDLSHPQKPAVWCEPGVTNRQLGRALKAAGLTMPWNVVLETVRIAGIVSVGTHGSGKDTETLGDLVEALEVIDADGKLRILSQLTVGEEVMSAARLGLGLFGVITRVRLRVVPSYRVRQADTQLPVREVLANIHEHIQAHDAIELFWFAHNKNLWLRTVDRSEAPHSGKPRALWVGTRDLVQHLWLAAMGHLVDRYARRLWPRVLRFGFSVLGFQTRVLDLAESHHYRKWIEVVRCGCIEVGFKMDARGDNVRQAFEAAERLVEKYAARGLHPMNLTLNVRFIGTSRALLSPAYGEGLTCYIEALCVGRSPGWSEFSAELCAEWMKLDQALPHWAKEFEHVPGILPLMQERLGTRLDRFRQALTKTGARTGNRNAFSNGLLDALLHNENGGA